ncbi:MAG: ABC transporter permease [Anaerolineales bacterium]|nr:MAG: ABC transporter permease [Anaerolineales bacterium]
MTTASSVVEVPTLPERKYRSLWGDVWLQFRKHRLAMLGVGILAILVLGVTVGPLIYTVDAKYIDVTAANAQPSREHPFGTDNLGRDTLARSMAGGRISLSVGITAMLIAIFFGTVTGLLAGYYPRLDSPLMRITDMFLALPQLPLLLVTIFLLRETLRAAFGPEAGIFMLIVFVIGILNWMPTARVVRAEVLSIKEQEFILAAKSIGTRNYRILIRHIFPNVLSPILVSATLGLAGAIINESALSFLGLGFPSDFPTWGRLLYDGKDFLTLTPSLVFWPGLFISLTVLSVNFIGDGLRDALDPRLRGR